MERKFGEPTSKTKIHQWKGILTVNSEPAIFSMLQPARTISDKANMTNHFPNTMKLHEVYKLLKQYLMSILWSQLLRSHINYKYGHRRIYK